MPIIKNNYIIRWLMVFLTLSISCTKKQTVVWPAREWAVSSMLAENLDEGPINKLIDEINQMKYGYIDHLLITRNGKKVLDKHFNIDYFKISTGKVNALGCGFKACQDPDSLNDYNYLHPLRHPYYNRTSTHTLQSITKSVTSILIGQAIQQQKIDGAEALLLSIFDNFDLSRTSPELQKATLQDLLTMRSGIEWHEGDHPLDSTNSALKLEKSNDWIQYVLNQPSDSKPGEKWVYSSGGSQLMSGIVKNTTGKHADEFANENLFAPLEISEFHWKKTPTGHADTEGGLFLKADDLAKIGYLYLRKGLWKDKVIIDSAWIKKSVMRHVDNVSPEGWGYGYQWWRTDMNGVEIWSCLGFGGNYLIVIPKYEIVAVVNAWNIFDNPAEPLLTPCINALLSSASRPSN